jgi:hypothetical protein
MKKRRAFLQALIQDTVCIQSPMKNTQDITVFLPLLDTQSDNGQHEKMCKSPSDAE